LIIMVALEDLLGLTPDAWPQAIALSAIIAAGVWILIWRRAVAWSLFVIRQTSVSALLCFGLPVAAQFLFWNQVTAVAEVIVACLPVLGWGAWMAVTINMWPVGVSDPQRIMVSPRCLKCGYLLIGLRSTRCPECGDEPTLDQLWKATDGVV
jgi:hypothetical protein